MRDYLYIWHDKEQKALVTSGLEFKDCIRALTSQEGIFLIKHESDVSGYDSKSGFDICPKSKLYELSSEDIYSWGDFVWADFGGSATPMLSESGIAELLYFAHKHRPLNQSRISGIDNKFLCSIHDDGWSLKLFYNDWNHVEELLRISIPVGLGALDIPELRKGESGFWLSAGNVKLEIKTHDIDAVLNRRL